MNRVLEIAHSQYGVAEKVGKLHNPIILNYSKKSDRLLDFSRLQSVSL